MKMKKMVVPFKIKQVDEDEEKNIFSFEGYASTFGNEDLGGDIVERGAFQTSINELNSSDKKLKVLWQHEHDTPLGIFVKFFEDEKGLFVRGILPKDDELVSGRVIPQMKIGSVDSMSIGYSIREEGADLIDDVWHLKDLKLWEVSLVTLPMNELAVVTDIKKVIPFQDLPIAPVETEWNQKDASTRVEEFSKDTSAKSRNSFIWRNKDKELSIADVINGKLMAVPRAIFEAAAVIHGAKGGVDMKEEERKGVIANIERYYDKMDLESPFKESGFAIHDFKYFDPRSLEHLLISGGVVIPPVFEKTAKAFISFLKRDVQDDKKRDADDWSKVVNELNQIKMEA